MARTLVFLCVATVLIDLRANDLQSESRSSGESTIQQAWTLHWKNGDSIPGKLLPSQTPWVQWKSPVFLDALRVNVRSLHSIRFPEVEFQPKPSFRFKSTTGDIFDADITGSNAENLILNSQIFGAFELKRKAAYSIRANNHPNLIFEGSQFDQWSVALGGPLNDFHYRVYQLNQQIPEGIFPDLSDMTPKQIGHLASSYFDLGISELKKDVAVVFDAQLEVSETATYRFHVSASPFMRFWVDDRLLVEAGDGKVKAADIHLDIGFHQLRIEYLNHDEIGDLRVWWSGPGFKNRSLVGTNRQMGWRRGLGGNAITTLKRTGLFKTVDLPEKFALEMELTSSGQLQFLIGLGKSEFVAESKESFRIETWGNDVVIARGDYMETIKTLREGENELDLRLEFDSFANTLDVFELNGLLLKHIESFKSTAGSSGVFIRNQGEDLAVRSVRIYSQAGVFADSPSVDMKRPRIQFFDQSWLNGELHIQADVETIRGSGLAEERIDSTEIGNFFPLNEKSITWNDGIKLIYYDGTTIQGELDSFTSSSIVIRTKFNDKPLKCQLSGVERLEFKGSPSMSDPLSRFKDTLSTSAGQFRGELVFGIQEAPFGWEPDGADHPLRIDDSKTLWIKRESTSSDLSKPYDLADFPAKIYLTTGEALPGRIVSYLEGGLQFESPYLSPTILDLQLIKAVEFISEPPSPYTTTSNAGEGNLILDRIFESGHSGAPISSEMKLEQILSSSSDSNAFPYEHLIITINGDLLRGTMLEISDAVATIQIKSRKIKISRERLFGWVNLPSEKRQQAFVNQSQAEKQSVFWLNDATVLVMDPDSSRDKVIIGQSAILGEVRLPASIVETIQLSTESLEVIHHKYGNWIIHPTPH